MLDFAVILQSQTWELLRAQAKLCYVGVQGESTPSVAFSPYTQIPDMVAFLTLQQGGLSYANDDSSVHAFTVKHSAFLELMRAAATLPEVLSGSRSGGYLSFMAFQDATSGIGYEAVLDRDIAKALVRVLLETVEAHSAVGNYVMDEFYNSLP